MLYIRLPLLVAVGMLAAIPYLTPSASNLASWGSDLASLFGYGVFIGVIASVALMAFLIAPRLIAWERKERRKRQVTA